MWQMHELSYTMPAFAFFCTGCGSEKQHVVSKNVLASPHADILAMLLLVG